MTQDAGYRSIRVNTEFTRMLQVCWAGEIDPPGTNSVRFSSNVQAHGHHGRIHDAACNVLKPGPKLMLKLSQYFKK